MYEQNSFLPSKLLTTLLIVLCLLSTTAYALKDDIEKPVYINADSVLFNKAKGFAVYEGNVSIVQGTLDIRAAKIEIKAPNSEIELITATGGPVKFQQKMDDGKLAKGPAITQNNDRFASNHIEYSINNGELKAGNKKSGGKSRVKAVFYPSNKK